MIAQVDSRYFQLRPAAAARRIVTRALFEGRAVTTDGRWFNPVVFAHFGLEKRLPQLKKVTQPIFIVGTGRSGTTILGAILSLHPQVGYLSEPKALWHSIFSEEDVNGNYSCGPARYRLSAGDATDPVKRAAHRLLGAYLAAMFAARAVDKDPELVFRVPFVRAIFPDARFVFLVRDGWNTCYSISTWSEKNGRQVNGETHDWWGVNNRKWNLMLEQLVAGDPAYASIAAVAPTFHTQVDMAAVEWIVTMREGLQYLEQYPECMFLLHYEAMVENPQKQLANLLDFCQLPRDEKLLDYARGTLSVKSKSPRLPIHEAILPLFRDTLNALGY